MNTFMKLATSSIVVALLTLTASVASAQMSNWHEDLFHCQEVYEGGKALEYRPAPNANRAQQRVNVAGVTRRPMPQDACLELLVADGRYHSVFIPKGTEMLWKGEALYAHPTCGNSVRGEPLWLTHQEVYRQSVAGRDGRDGAQGPRGERGPPGRSIPAPPQGGVYEGYSSKELARDVSHDLIWGVVTDRVTGKLVNGWVRREEIRAQARVQSEYWRSQRGPTHLSVTQTGNCNAAFGSRTNCVTQFAPGPAGPPGPPGRDGRDGQPGGGSVPPIYTPPGEPSPGRPPYTPPAEPVFGGGGYTPPANPIYNQPAGPADPIGNPGYTPPGGPVYNGPSDPVPYTPPGGG